MLLLQIDMLAYIDESLREPVAVVGAGVPPEWLDQPMQVKGLPTSVGVIDWSYNNRVLEVTVHSEKKVPVRPGPNLTNGVTVQVRYV
jgi:hypothetical protein